MIESHISGNLYNEHFSESSDGQCTIFQWLGLLLFIKVLLKTVQLLSKHFPPSLSLCILYFGFHKGKDTSAIPQPSVHHLVYVFPIFFCFHKCFNNFEKCVISYFTSMTQKSCQFLFEIK